MSNDNDSWLRIRLGLSEPAKAASGVAPTCDEMRKAIYASQRESALIRRCLDTAHYAGMSGEDTYVLLAYHALLQLEDTHQRFMQLWNITAMPTVVPKR